MPPAHWRLPTDPVERRQGGQKKNSTRSHSTVKGIAVKCRDSVSEKVAKARTSHLGSCTLRTKQLHLLLCLGCWFLLRVMYFVPSHESTGHIEGGDMSGILTTRSRWHCLVPGRYRITLATTILVASAELPNPNISRYHQSCWLASLRRPSYSGRGNKVYSLFHRGRRSSPLAPAAVRILRRFDQDEPASY